MLPGTLLALLVGAASAAELTESACTHWFSEPLDGFACGFVTVEEGIHLAVLRWRPERIRGRPVLVPQGGPGSEHVGWVNPEDPVLVALLEQGREVILFDTRGTGWSEPRLACGPLYELHLMSLGGGALEREAWNEAIRDCALPHRDNLRAFRWEDAVRDAVVVREALGIERWDVVGVSAGATYPLDLAAQDPEGTGRVVVSGVPDPDDLRSTLGMTLERIIDDCQADPACTERHPDPDATVDRGLSALAALPTDGRAASYDQTPRTPAGAYVSLQMGLYASDEAATLLDRLDTAATDVEGLGNWWIAWLRNYLDESAMLAVTVQRCSRWSWSRIDPSERPLLRDIHRSHGERSTPCEVLGIEPGPPARWDRVRAPVLSLHGTWDVATPTGRTADALEDVPDHTAVVFPGRSHDVINDPCALSLLRDHLAARPLDPACVAHVHPA